MAHRTLAKCTGSYTTHTTQSSYTYIGRSYTTLDTTQLPPRTWIPVPLITVTHDLESGTPLPQGGIRARPLLPSLPKGDSARECAVRQEGMHDDAVADRDVSARGAGSRPLVREDYHARAAV